MTGYDRAPTSGTKLASVFTHIGLGLGVLIGLGLIAHRNYLLFHCMVDIVGMVVGCGVFLVAWNSRRCLGNSLMLFLGTAFLFSAGMESLHMLANKGMGVFPNGGLNLSLQLVVASRFILSGAFLIAPAFLRRQVEAWKVLLGFTAVFSVLLVSIFAWKIFPDCYVEGIGLTGFMTVGVYVVCGVFLVSIIVLFKYRDLLGEGAWRLLSWAIVSYVVSLLVLMSQGGAPGLPHFFAHCFQLVAYYLVYKAVVQTGLQQPFDLLVAGLQRERQLLASIVQTANEAIISLDAQGNIASWNRGAEAMFGYSGEEAIGQSVAVIVPRRFREVHRDGMMQVLTEGTLPERRQTDKWFGRRKDGTEVPVELSAAVWETAEGRFMTAVIRDITERKQAQEALEAAKTQLEQRVQERTAELRQVNEELRDEISRRAGSEQRLAENLEVLQAIFNAITESLLVEDSDGRIVTRNKTAAQRFGTSVEDAVGRLATDFFPLNLIHSRKPKMRAVIESGKPVRWEDTRAGILFDIHAYPVLDEALTVRKIVVFGRDITEQRRVEIARRESEERFRAIFDSARDFIFCKDRSLTYTHVNPAMEKLFGLTSPELVGLRDEELFGKEASSMLRDVDLRVLDGDTAESEHSLLINKFPTALGITKVPIRDRDGNITGVCGIARDITDRQVAREIGVPKKHRDDEFLGGAYPSAAMRAVLELARLAAKTDSVILLFGESGSGKDHLAHLIHKHSRRAAGPYFVVNCAAVPRDLAESELFGHEAGAFSGAAGRKRGLLELAEGGTLLLNEIGELSPRLQAKLLTFLDTRSFTRVGGEKKITVNARLIAATNKDLDKEMAEGRFRSDLFYRLNVFAITVPPLRDRIEDLPLLVRQILEQLTADMQLPRVPELYPWTMNALARYKWHGNVRELRNVLERALILSGPGELRIDTLTAPSIEEGGWVFPVSFPQGEPLTKTIDEVKQALVNEALRRSEGAKQTAADMLGISRFALLRMMKGLDLDAGA